MRLTKNQLDLVTELIKMVQGALFALAAVGFIQNMSPAHKDLYTPKTTFISELGLGLVKPITGGRGAGTGFVICDESGSCSAEIYTTKHVMEDVPLIRDALVMRSNGVWTDVGKPTFELLPESEGAVRAKVAFYPLDGKDNFSVVDSYIFQITSRQFIPAQEAPPGTPLAAGALRVGDEIVGRYDTPPELIFSTFKELLGFYGDPAVVSFGNSGSPIVYELDGKRCYAAFSTMFGIPHKRGFLECYGGICSFLGENEPILRLPEDVNGFYQLYFPSSTSICMDP